jgi:hypothetical protein
MSRDKVDVAKRATDAYNRRDVDGLFAELATPDFEWYPAIVRALDGGGYRGREGIEEFAADTRENWEEVTPPGIPTSRAAAIACWATAAGRAHDPV